ncbi:hypothetical protein ACIQXM_01280 [Arthrobacter sp. NPDC097144]
MDTAEPTREWRRKHYRRSRREWISYAGLALLTMVTASVVAAVLMQ